MAIEQLHRKSWNMEFWIIEDADLEEEIWSLRRFSRRDLVFNKDTRELKKGPGIWEDMELIAGLSEAGASAVPGTTYIIDTGSTNTAQDPGQNTIRINDASLASATQMTLSDVDDEAVDQGILNSLVGGVLVLRNQQGGVTCSVLVTAITRPGAYTRYTIQHLEGSFPADGTVVILTRLPAPEPKVWNGLVYWNGGSPYATVLGKNTIGDIVVSDNGSGDGSGLNLTLTGAFPSGKTICFAGNAGYDTNNDNGVIYASRYSASIIGLTGSLDYPFAGCPVKIEVYP